ncbi:MAG: universal stress protein, partial [Alphaproteobacteria bacterium]
MIADILAYIDGRDSAANAAETAFLLAARFGARVEGLHVRADARDFISREPVYSDAAALAQFSESFDRQAATQEAAAEAAFEAARARFEADEETPRGSVAAQWTVQPGRPAEQVCLRGRVADLTVIGRGGYGPRNPTSALIEAALLDTGGPVLIAPPHVPASVGRSIVIAWKPSAASGK